MDAILARRNSPKPPRPNALVLEGLAIGVTLRDVESLQAVVHRAAARDLPGHPDRPHFLRPRFPRFTRDRVYLGVAARHPAARTRALQVLLPAMRRQVTTARLATEVRLGHYAEDDVPDGPDDGTTYMSNVGYTLLQGHVYNITHNHYHCNDHSDHRDNCHNCNSRGDNHNNYDHCDTRGHNHTNPSPPNSYAPSATPLRPALPAPSTIPQPISTLAHVFVARPLRTARTIAFWLWLGWTLFSLSYFGPTATLASYLGSSTCLLGLAAMFSSGAMRLMPSPAWGLRALVSLMPGALRAVGLSAVQPPMELPAMEPLEESRAVLGAAWWLVQVAIHAAGILGPAVWVRVRGMGSRRS